MQKWHHIKQVKQDILEKQNKRIMKQIIAKNWIVFIQELFILKKIEVLMQYKRKEIEYNEMLMRLQMKIQAMVKKMLARMGSNYQQRTTSWIRW